MSKQTWSFTPELSSATLLTSFLHLWADIKSNVEKITAPAFLSVSAFTQLGGSRVRAWSLRWHLFEDRHRPRWLCQRTRSEGDLHALWAFSNYPCSYMVRAEEAPPLQHIRRFKYKLGLTKVVGQSTRACFCLNFTGCVCCCLAGL